MSEKRKPSEAGQRPTAQPQAEIMPMVGTAQPDQGAVVPLAAVGPLLQAQAGELRANMEKELAQKLGDMDTTIAGLRTDLQNKPGWGGVWAISGVIVTTALAVLGLVYTFLMNSSDRSETGVQIGMEIGRALEAQKGQINGEQIDAQVGTEAKQAR